MTSFKIRPALMTDLHQIVTLDNAANAAHPMLAIPWKQYSDIYGVFLSRYLHFLNYPRKFQFLVATMPSSSKVGEEEIVGFLAGATPKNKDEASGIGGEEGDDGEGEWSPILPDGTNGDFFNYFMGVGGIDKKRFKTGDMWELEQLTTSVDHRRKGIASKLMEEWLKAVDEDGRAVYIRASKQGKELYEKFGCKDESTFWTDLEKFGADPYVNYNMVRSGKR